MSWDALEIWETGADQTKQNLHTSFQRHTMHSSHDNSIDYHTSIYWGGHGDALVILSLGLTQCGGRPEGWEGCREHLSWAFQTALGWPTLLPPPPGGCCPWTFPGPFLAICAAHVLSASGDSGWSCLLELQEGQGSQALPGKFPRLSFRTSPGGACSHSGMGWSKPICYLLQAEWPLARDVRSQYSSAFSPLPTLEGRRGGGRRLR